MSLPLMPSSEVFQREPEPVYKSEVIQGCQCAMCVGAQAYQSPPPVPRSPTPVWEDPIPASPVPMNWQTVQNGRIRGRYDFSAALPDSCLDGQVRWRRPGTCDVLDEQGRRQWTFTKSLPDGSLTDGSGHRWYPTEV